MLLTPHLLRLLITILMIRAIARRTATALITRIMITMVVIGNDFYITIVSAVSVIVTAIIIIIIVVRMFNTYSYYHH